MKTVNQLQAELMKQKEAYQTSQKKLKAELRKAQKEAEREARIAEQKKMNEENKIVCDFIFFVLILVRMVCYCSIHYFNEQCRRTMRNSRNARKGG